MRRQLTTSSFPAFSEETRELAQHVLDADGRPYSSRIAAGPGLSVYVSGENRLPPIREHDDVTRLEVGAKWLEETEVVAGRIMETVGVAR